MPKPLNVTTITLAVTPVGDWIDPNYDDLLASYAERQLKDRLRDLLYKELKDDCPHLNFKVTVRDSGDD